MKVAIVGSGPTGRAAARELAAAGVDVTVFEKESEPGGLMRWGYPDFRMPSSVTRRDVTTLQELGVTFRAGTALGEHVTLDELERGHDAVLLTVGAPRPKRLGIPGEDSPGVHGALEYLYASRAGRPLPAGPDVLVVGGGDTAVDAAVTAARQDVGTVTIWYRGPADRVSAQPHEVERSRRAGVRWRFGVRPARIDVSGGPLSVTPTSPESPDPGPEAFHTVVVAIGQEPDPAVLRKLGITAGADGSTDRAKVWVAGGSRYGSDRLAKAIQDGRAAARRILR